MTIFDDLYNILIKPVADAFGNILRPVTDAIDQARINAEAQTSTDAYKRKKPTGWFITRTKSAITPDTAYKAAWDYTAAVEPALLAIALTHVSMETGTLGQVDVSLSELSNLPYVKDDSAIAYATRMAEFAEGAYPAIRRYYLKKLTPLLPESYRLALAKVKGLLSNDEYISAMAESGLEDKWAKTWEEQNYEYPSFAQLAELRWRGVIDDTTFTLWMQRNSAKPETIEALKNLMQLIPPAQDLVTMVVREAFDERYITPAPDVFAKYMAMKGFDRDWSNRYWTMHWQPIPLAQAYRNLHWGNWTKEDFLEALRIADLHPQWREDVYNVAFLPPSIRELGYGYDVGEYTFDDIITYRRRGGLTEGDAIKAAKSLIAYRTEAEREAVRREHLHLYALGKEDAATYKSNLQRLGTNPQAIELWLERGELETERIAKEASMPEQRITSSSEALWAFEHELQTEADTRKQLADLYWVPERIDLAIKRSIKDIADAKAKAEAVTERELTIAQARDLYKAGKVSRDELPQLLIALHYRKEDAQLLAETIADEVDSELLPRKLTVTEVTRLYDVRLLGVPHADARKSLDAIIQAEGVNSPSKALLGFYGELNYDEYDATKLTLWTIINLNLPDIKAMYSKGWITATAMVNEFIRLGLPVDRANEIAMTIVKAEQPTRTAAERDLTKAEIIKGAKQEILTVTQASELLQGIGYDANEAMYLLYINAVVARGDPEGYWEMRKVIEQGKKARGEKAIEIPDELITLELNIKDAKANIERMKKEKASDEVIAEAVLKLGGLESRVKTLLIAYKIS